MKIKPEKISLFDGFTDKDGVTHKDVEIGKLTKADELFFIERVWGDLSPTVLSSYLLSYAITKFGSLKTPVSNDTLLELFSEDFEDLITAYNRFTEQNGTPMMIDGKTVKLAYGLERSGVVYDLAEFGNLTTGKDKVEAEMKGLAANRKTAFLAGKEVIRLKQSKGKLVLEGELNLETIGELYLIDALGLMQQSKVWNSFRRFTSISENAKPETD